ncbi:hypothetical protein FH972_021682 [Carpinus fangiana]|uniref:Uncharacterized protein n=1 Tax=Carpinus fangiana TaxID=176857 RepID=A0A5N6KQD8_9ROSI|nr:hypothetical protein FH972_021682 [Carpinus fangiana]
MGAGEYTGCEGLLFIQRMSCTSIMKIPRLRGAARVVIAWKPGVRGRRRCCMNVLQHSGALFADGMSRGVRGGAEKRKRARRRDDDAARTFCSASWRREADRSRARGRGSAHRTALTAAVAAKSITLLSLTTHTYTHTHTLSLSLTASAAAGAHANGPIAGLVTGQSFFCRRCAEASHGARLHVAESNVRIACLSSPASPRLTGTITSWHGAPCRPVAFCPWRAVLLPRLQATTGLNGGWRPFGSSVMTRSLSLAESHPTRTTAHVPTLISRRSDDHLRHSLTPKRLAANEALSPDTCERVEERRNEQNNCRGEQAGRTSGDQCQPLHNAHNQVDGGAHVVGLKAADEGVELGRSRADAQQQRDLDEEDDGRACPAAVYGSTVARGSRAGLTREAGVVVVCSIVACCVFEEVPGGMSTRRVDQGPSELDEIKTMLFGSLSRWRILAIRYARCEVCQGARRGFSDG